LAERRPTDPPKGVPEDALDRIFHGPLESFTPERNELAKSLRADGKAEAADWVKALRKPSRGAWLVNQLAVRKTDEIRELLAVGEELRSAQEEMLAGAADRSKLRDAARREQETIDSLLGSAEAIGREYGIGAQSFTRVGETLQAASSDPEVAQAIERGWLIHEQRAASVGLAGPAAPSAPARRGRGKRDDAAERRARQQTAKRRQTAEHKLAMAEKRLARERDALARARDAVEEAEKRAHSAELDVSAARRALEEI
jgi:hypothetical protein